mmetsp:Transcript_25297/g.49445  ORF Transcript_25297/g.49445 Transcript_25297/m.49445 type:complete len:329 (+) Transcript_25297:1317-2303(+)
MLIPDEPEFAGSAEHVVVLDQQPDDDKHRAHDLPLSDWVVCQFVQAESAPPDLCTTFWIDETQNDDGGNGGSAPDDQPDVHGLEHVPVQWFLCCGHVVLRACHDRDVVDSRNNEDNEGRHLEFESDDTEPEDQLEEDRGADTIHDVGFDSSVDLSGEHDGSDDSSQPRLEKRDVGSALGCLCRPCDSDSDGGEFECGCVVDSVSCHSNQVAVLHQGLHNLELVLRVHSCKSVDRSAELREVWSVEEGLGVRIDLPNVLPADVDAHPEHLRRLNSDGLLVACNHLHLDTQCLCEFDGLLCVISGRVEERDVPDELAHSDIVNILRIHRR